MVESARQTAKSKIDVIVYVDSDDLATMPAVHELRLDYIVGPRIRNITQCWNVLVERAKKECPEADIFMQGNDDIIFRTPNWDEMVEAEFAKYPDRILMVHGDDLGCNRERAGPHPLVHRRWIDAVGYFIPPHFSSDFGDTWLNDVANGLGRRVFLPFVVEHMHFAFGKAAVDQTTRERLQRHDQDRPEVLYEKLLPEREADIAKLRALMS